ncbi:MAG: N-acetyltransferase family protein [Bauldia sp.]
MSVVVRPMEDRDLPAILAIYNDAVANTTAIWNDSQVDLENRRAWASARRALGYPVLVAEAGGAILGYGSFGDFRAFDGYRFTVEDSVYVAAEARGRGVATAILAALVVAARGLGKHVMLAAITADNAVSIRLHEKQGFAVVGRLPEVGTKFGRWQDLVLMQLML